MVGNALLRVKRFGKVLLGYDVSFRNQIKCQTERHGSSYGGWSICPKGLTKEAVVYSFGLGEDISFDLSVIKKYGFKVYGFDPSPKAVKWLKEQQLPREFTLVEIGLAHYDGTAFFKPPENPEHASYTMLERPATEGMKVEVKVNRLKTILGSLGHDRLDILKMDIEGAEYEVLDDIMESAISIDQLLVEFHHGVDNITAAQTKRAIKNLNQHGYRIFDVSQTGREYSFIRID
jgi:FkbM family methyltransferase